MVKSLR